jgi:hypothetical protein
VGWPGFSAAGNQPVAATQKSRLSKAHLEQMADQFRSLRRIPGHFEGGTWNDDVDQWMGRKHKLMLELGSRLGEGAYQNTDIIQLLEPPDHIARKGDHLYDLIISLPGYHALPTTSYEFLVYSWRGMHDFLFFTCTDGIIIDSDWWYAGD